MCNIIEKSTYISTILCLIFSTIMPIQAKFNDNKIDFSTSAHDEIIIHFRFNDVTNELEMKSPLAKIFPPISDNNQKGEVNGDEKPQDNISSKSNGGDNAEMSTKGTTDTAVKATLTEQEQTHREDESVNTTENISTASKDSRVMEATTTNPLSVDSCSRNCTNEAHIACGHNWTPATDCGQSAQIVNLKPHQKLILDLHNDLRNKLAGNLTNFEPAARMGTVQWHDELAEYALLNAIKCDDEHDWCHNTKEFHRTGQNLARKMWAGRRHQNSVENIITNMIMGWYGESQYARQADMDNFQSNMVDGEEISHFATMMNERNTHIGCAAVQIEKDQRMNMFLTCNYARNNIFDVPIYVKGPTGSQCETGPNPIYENLCSENEVYDYNN